MSRKHFYSHIVETSTLSLAIGEIDLAQKERVNLLSLVESNLHHAILDAVLLELSEEDKKIFLHHLVHDAHDKVWNLLNEKVKNIEEKIWQVAENVKKELHSDIKQAHRKAKIKS